MTKRLALLVLLWIVGAHGLGQAQEENADSTVRVRYSVTCDTQEAIEAIRKAFVKGDLRGWILTAMVSYSDLSQLRRSLTFFEQPMFDRKNGFDNCVVTDDFVYTAQDSDEALLTVGERSYGKGIKYFMWLPQIPEEFWREQYRSNEVPKPQSEESSHG